MLFTQKMKISEIKSFKDSLPKSCNSTDQLMTLCQNLMIEIDLPGVDVKELTIDFSENILKISKKNDIEDKFPLRESEDIVAHNASTKVARGLAARMANTNDPVVIYGDHGTGKGLFARTIHQQSVRRDQPFVSISCSAIDSQQQLAGSLIDITEGTLLLDGIQDLDTDAQSALEEVIRNLAEQEGVRLITTTSINLEDLVRSGELSADLWDLLQGCYIELLPLRQRKEDIESLVIFYMEKICRECGLKPKNLSPDLLRMLESYPWPGNVLELVNTLEQLLITAQEKQTLFAKDLPTHIRIQTINTSAAHKKGI